ncbi:glycosyltransferase family 2 protein [Patescibacteria group bacterium]|nr:glycosyltransferase family 2 protein [Patescibacteria group bacterium]MBU1890901.1 glycosyltransferase family 2 protein [Patescibacteria group bacterium]
MSQETVKNTNPEVTISLVIWNSENDLPEFFNTLKKQTYKNYKVIVVDNNSSDASVEYVNQNYPEYKLIRNKENLGYGAAHNQVIKEALTPFVLVANPDIRLNEHFLEVLVSYIKKDKTLGSVGSKLIKFSGSLNVKRVSDIIDSVGIKAYKNRRFVDRGEGEADQGQYNYTEEVFGISGALVLFRKEALEDVVLNGKQYFDEDFFMYKEDIDLAWRLRLRCWKNYYVYEASAWHRRSSQTNTDSNDLQVVKNRSKKFALINGYSYRNHWYTLIKNESLLNLLLFSPWITWYELKKAVFVFLFEPRTLFLSLLSVKKLLSIIRKRIYIQKRVLADSKEIRKWFK